MLKIYIKEMKLNRKSLLFWSIALLLTALMGIAEYPFLAENLDMLMQSINSLPRIIIIMFGMEGLSLDTALDYYLVMYYYYALFVFFHAVHTGFMIIAKEEKFKTAEFLYTKPLKRHEILISKFLAGITNVAVLSIVCAVITIAGMLPVLKALNLIPIVLITTLGMFLTQLVFFASGAMCAALFRRLKSGSLSAYLIVIITYALAIVIRYMGNINFLNFLSPFQYFIATEVSRTGLNPVYILISIMGAGILLLLTIFKYNNRELMI